MKNFILFVCLFLNLNVVSAQLAEFEWVQSVGAEEESTDGSHIAVDKWGNVYTLGTFGGTCDMDPSAGKLNLTASGRYDIYISKFDRSGKFIWAKQIKGSDDNDKAYGIVVDDLGDVYVTGNLTGTMDFDPGSKVYDLASAGATDFFLLKLNADGNLVWVKPIGGMDNEGVLGMEMDASGNFLLYGNFMGSFDADPSAGTFMVPAGQGNTFILKLDHAGQFIWAKNFGGPYTNITSLRTDKKNYIYCVGYFSDNADFDPSSNILNIKASGSNAECKNDAMVLKMDDLGNLVWAKNFGGNNKTFAFDIAVDNDYNVYVSGHADEVTDFDPNAGTYTIKSKGYNDGFITKWDASGNFYWAKMIGGPSYGDLAYRMAIDQNDDLYVLGRFNGTVDMGLGGAFFPLISKSSQDNYILKMDKSGKFIDAKGFASTCNNFKLQSNENLYFTGYYGGSCDFDPDPSKTYSLKSTGHSDAYTVKWRNNSLSIATNQQKNNAFSVYPNPSSAVFTITSFDEQQIRVYNTTGAFIRQMDVPAGSRTEIDLSGYPAGSYTVEAWSDGHVAGIQKIVKN